MTGNSEKIIKYNCIYQTFVFSNFLPVQPARLISLAPVGVLTPRLGAKRPLLNDCLSCTNILGFRTDTTLGKSLCYLSCMPQSTRKANRSGFSEHKCNRQTSSWVCRHIQRVKNSEMRVHCCVFVLEDFWECCSEHRLQREIQMSVPFNKTTIFRSQLNPKTQHITSPAPEPLILQIHSKQQAIQ